MSENRLWWATLNRTSPRYAAWHEILDSNDVPLTAPQPLPAQLGVEIVDVYLLDLQRLNPAQVTRLVNAIADRTGKLRAQVGGALLADGCPIRAADVHVAFSLRAFI
jgi:hypothetical protein